MLETELRSTIEPYLKRRDLTIIKLLGHGTDGCVWETNQATAVKLFERERQYLCERDAYKRLKEHGITQIDNFAIPKLVSWDNRIRVVEMGIVAPPRILDFGKVYIDCQPVHTEEVIADTEERNQDVWDDRWPQVQSILWQLQTIGIYYQDPSANNIAFDDDPE